MSQTSTPCREAIKTRHLAKLENFRCHILSPSQESVNNSDNSLLELAEQQQVRHRLI